MMESNVPMATVTESKLRFAAKSLEIIDLFRDQLGESLKTLAAERAIADGRELVTAEDVMGAFQELFAKAAGAERR